MRDKYRVKRIGGVNKDSQGEGKRNKHDAHLIEGKLEEKKNIVSGKMIGKIYMKTYRVKKR